MRKPGRFFGVLLMVFAFPPFINSVDNPRIAMLHRLDVFRLIGAGALFGFGLALFIFGVSEVKPNATRPAKRPVSN